VIARDVFNALYLEQLIELPSPLAIATVLFLLIRISRKKLAEKLGENFF
jgi:hypothetical protein